MNKPATNLRIKGKHETLNYFKRYWTLYLLLALPLVYFAVFKYVPAQYMQVAFKTFKTRQSVWTLEWANNNGMQYFIQAFKNRDFIYAIRNTVGVLFLTT